MAESPETESPLSPATHKRKRSTTADEELEINLALPEPASKKAKRKEKKDEGKKGKRKDPSDLSLAAKDLASAYFNSDAAQSSAGPQIAQKRSEFGIWIGNLPFTAGRETIRNFLKDEGGIDGKDIVRLHMPTTANKTAGKAETAQNKGFAYVDFTTEEVLDKAITLSEKLINGRRSLIKNARSFEGRPVKDGASGVKASNKEPSKRVFIGNLSFDVTKEHLVEHFSQAGEVEDIFMATFEDTGKCKGFAWVRFVELEAAEAAVTGYIYKDADDGEGEDGDGSDEDDEGKGKKRKSKKRQKWFINRLQGRQLRCEFAEDAQTRYKKRYGKDAKGSRGHQNDDLVEANANADAGAIEGDAEVQSFGDEAAVERHAQHSAQASHPRQRPDKDQRREDRRKRHDARTIAPGKALANTQRASGAIVAGAGRKMTFDE